MSYSLIFVAANAYDAKSRIASELSRIVQSQPAHALDRALVQSAAEQLVDMLPQDASQDLQVSLHGSISWTGGLTHDNPIVVHGASMSIGVANIPRV